MLGLLIRYHLLFAVHVDLNSKKVIDSQGITNLHCIFARTRTRLQNAKMSSVGLAPKLCKLFESFLSARSIKVVVDGISYSSFHTNAGVPQGSVISPTLFLIYINDLLNLPSNPVHCYADDSTLHNAPASHKDLN